MSSGWGSLEAIGVTDGEETEESIDKRPRQGAESSTTESGFGSYKDMSLKQQEESTKSTGDYGDDTDDGTSVDTGKNDLVQQSLLKIQDNFFITEGPHV